MSSPVLWEPSHKQSEFLACSEREVLYGGAAGGGKTDGMLIDALCLQHGGLTNRNHKAIIFRRTYPELRDLIARSHELYQAIYPGAAFNKQEHVWSFPSGASVEVGHLQHDSHRFKYRGRAFNYIGFEELTTWTTDVCYLYLFSRLRSTDRSLPRYMRATTNPDGPGQAWVMKRWGIEEDGHPTCIEYDQETEVWSEERQDWVLQTEQVRRLFIPAKLTDNPHLRGTGYREALLELPPEEREALLEGKWTGNRLKGAYYFAVMQKMRAENRVTTVPVLTNTPVNTFWDLGRSDLTAIVMHQHAGLEHRFPDCYANSGEDLSHYANYLLGRGYVYGTHYLPHDADHRSLHPGSKTLKESLQDLLPNQRIVTVPRVQNVLFGIQQTRTALGSAWIDRERCADLIAALDGYRSKWNEKLDCPGDEPLHDGSSHYADAIRQWAQGYSFPAVQRPRDPNKARRRAGGGSNWRTV